MNIVPASRSSCAMPYSPPVSVHEKSSMLLNWARAGVAAQRATSSKTFEVSLMGSASDPEDCADSVPAARESGDQDAGLQRVPASHAPDVSVDRRQAGLRRRDREDRAGLR